MAKRDAGPLPPLPQIKIDIPENDGAPVPKVLLYGYCQSGLAGHFGVFKIEVPVTDSRLVEVASRLPKRAAFEKVLFLVREQLFRAVVRYRRPAQESGA